ncbi:MAG: 6-phosphogluconolactonase [Cyanobacteriota bacterium]
MVRVTFRLVVAPAAELADQLAVRLIEEVLMGLSQPLGLATGATMEPLYAALGRRVAALSEQQGQTLRQGWRSFNLDDYVGLGLGDPASVAATMERQLSARLGLQPGTVQLPDGLAADPAAEARRYAEALAAAGGLGLQVLGLGLNGHVGFNEPPCSPEACTRLVDLTEATRDQNAPAFAGRPGGVPDQAITVGLAEILAARQLVLVVTGAAKASILARALGEPPTPEVPASWLQRHPALLVLADPAAAALLR